MTARKSTDTSDEPNKNMRAPNDPPSPVTVRHDPALSGYVFLPGNWSNSTRSRRAQGYVGPQGPISYVGPQGPISYGGPQGPLGTDAGPQGPIGDFVTPGIGAQVYVGMGYHADVPDYRDCQWRHLTRFAESMSKAKAQRVKRIGERAAEAIENPAQLPKAYNIGDEHPLPPVENQGHTNSCTAQAAAGMVEYLYRRATGQFNDFSRMFIYFNSRKLLAWTGDLGSYIRTTFKAMRLFGIPPENEWPFDVSLLNADPLPYHYAYAQNFKTFKYARLDGYDSKPDNSAGNGLYERVKQMTYAGFPVEFGFPVYSSLISMKGWTIPIPALTDRLLGGHAVLAVGYNDELRCPMPPDPAKDDSESTVKAGEKFTKGALIIRNSWGADWGDHGYAYLPRWYLDSGCAADFWTAYDEDWLDLKDFGD